ncbi:hypothetical protein CEP52_004628 [Fusarium oligoseptatum]|nr:hypothetical protein CEP52_004628 [Fusarium oligoseptatum]
MTAILPFEIKDALAGEISRVLDQIHLAIQWNERTLGSYEKSYTTEEKLCMKCGRLPSRDVRDDRCRRCSSDVLDSLCTTETRIAAYFRCLETHKLWPSVQPFKIHTISTLEDRIKRTVAGIVADVNGISLDKLELDVMT